MTTFKQGRYSGYLKHISYLIDLSIINGLALLYFFKTVNPIKFVLLISTAWIILSISSKFYEVYRYSREINIAALLLKQFALFTLLMLAFSGFNHNLDIRPLTIFKYTLATIFLIGLSKFALYYLLQKYRTAFGGNFRKTVIVGKNKQTAALESFFNNKPEYGYIHKKTFNSKEKEKFSLEACFNFIIEESIDEIYCSISELSNSQMYKIIDFADNNLKILKFLPDNKDIHSKKLKYEYYDYIPILSLRNIPLEDSVNQFVKRTFDIFFSSLVIIFILSWLTPIIAILIKLESKGPVFFKQSRNGFNYKEFDCYKFRSMMPNQDAHLYQATRGDQRITKIGKFIRKTSIDELPQFFNVLLGNMSVVGPRPHLWTQNKVYGTKVKKYMIRHHVKPGVTGLAQVRGYRGEIETDNDMVNRIKYDVFYIENWSLFMDIKIIALTIINIFKGEEKAY